jgi:hypothetical protein
MTRTRTDNVLLVLTGVFVAGLAVVAGAISFAHMVELASRHDQTGWKAYAFPISVDGLEIVASLYLVAQRRAGRSTGAIPWVALVVGTLASLAANVAVGGHDLIGKALAGWPALSMLVSVKLLFSMFDHVEGDLRTVRDDQRTAVDRPAVPEPAPGGSASFGTVPAGAADDTARSATGTDWPAVPDLGRAGAERAGPVEVRTVAHLIPAARAARAALVDSGRRLSRDGLAETMRIDGHGVSNAHASLLLKVLKAEAAVRPFASTGILSGDIADRGSGTAVIEE